MNYQETLEFLYKQLPVFEKIGYPAYKPGLERVFRMHAVCGHPQLQFKSIHVAGTNGKGTCSHTIASILQEHGLKVGLFTSPHLLDFKERIRVNGEPIEEQFVVDWTKYFFRWHKSLEPSFFELATIMAFCYFAEKKVDVAVVEVGLGGRLDATNILRPDLCVITNVSFDHTQFLGHTITIIANEKAGIMKKDTPCVIGECDDKNVRNTYEYHAERVGVSKLTYACDNPQIGWVRPVFGKDPHNEYETRNNGPIECPLMGACQPKNANTILAAVHQLNLLGYNITDEELQAGFKNVIKNTHLMGRWQTLSEHPHVICDTGHNEGCFRYIGPQLQQIIDFDGKLNIVFGMVSDKDIPAVLQHLPKKARYFWCNAPTSRAMPAEELAELADQFELYGEVYPSVEEAFNAAVSPDVTTFVGGSNFVVAEVLKKYME